MPEDALIGPVRRPHNRYLELPGSIHNNEVASKLGFRGGTVAGSVHMDQFVPLLLERVRAVVVRDRQPLAVLPVGHHRR